MLEQEGKILGKRNSISKEELDMAMDKRFHGSGGGMVCCQAHT